LQRSRLESWARVKLCTLGTNVPHYSKMSKTNKLTTSPMALHLLVFFAKRSLFLSEQACPPSRALRRGGRVVRINVCACPVGSEDLSASGGSYWGQSVWVCVGLWLIQKIQLARLWRVNPACPPIFLEGPKKMRNL